MKTFSNALKCVNAEILVASRKQVRIKKSGLRPKVADRLRGFGNNGLDGDQCRALSAPIKQRDIKTLKIRSWQI
jgi:hypothetical protein